MDLALNNLQWLICHKTKPNQTNIYINMVFEEFSEVTICVVVIVVGNGIRDSGRDFLRFTDTYSESTGSH